MTTPARVAPETTTATDRAHTPLLTLLTQDALDSDYAAVSSRPAHTRRQRNRLSGGTLAVLLAFGVLVAIAAVQTDERADMTSAGRSELIRRVEAQRDMLDDIQLEITDLRAENSALTAQSRSLADGLAALTATGDLLGATAVVWLVSR